MDKKKKYVMPSMKKNFIFGIAAALMMGTVALSSCSNDELTVGNEVAKEVAKTYSFSVPAIMDDGAGTRVFTLGESTITSKFDESEAVYVFIKDSEGNFAYGNSPLYPTMITNGGKSCTFEGNLSFYTYDDDSGYSEFTPAVGDKVYLYYGMSDNLENPFERYFNFETIGNGSKDKAQRMDYNLAMTTIKSADKGVLTFNDTFSFTNINSIFRQKLKIVDKDGDVIDYTTILSIVISLGSNMTVKQYYPLDGEDAYEYGDDGTITITSPDFTESTDIYFSLIFNDENKNEAITFTAYDGNGYTYTCTKAAPNDPDNPDNSGFKNNMYYYGGATLVKVEVTEEDEGPNIPTH